MTVSKNKFSYGNEILFVAIMVLLFAPHDYKLPGLGILCFCLIIAAFIDWEKNKKRVRRITRRVASCSCVKARETISNMQVPQLFNCTVCGAETT
ncbi:MAG: hypothetical protein EKK48_17885 [Candidatus Melainabacteria bacterium]|nr:MAG: hypothetical protein EKK48_17885 [Candidatus Melainabacteria bacterium]